MRKVHSILGNNHPLVGITKRERVTPQISNRVDSNSKTSLSSESVKIPQNKTIMLLELNSGYVDADIKRTFEYYWNNYPAVWSSTEIINTNIDINNSSNILVKDENIIVNNIANLNYYYSLGYRLFIGFCRSTILAGVLSWFDAHPDALGISLTSSSDRLAIPKSVYRLQPLDSGILKALKPILDSSPQIFYFYSKNQNASESLLQILNNLYGNKFYSYAIEDDSSNITKTQLENFYSMSGNINPNATSIIYLFIGTQTDDYLNVYNIDFPMPNKNYDITNQKQANVNENSKPYISNNYNVLYFYSLSTSLMFREGLNDLSGFHVKAASNALLLQQFLNEYGKQNINAISSHNDILEFDDNKDLKYYSVITYIYKNVNSSYVYEKSTLYIFNPIVDGLTFNF